jgi:hypothetical protein
MILHHDADATRLAVVRIAVFGWWFVLVARTPTELYQRLPPALWDSRGFLRALPVDALVSSPALLVALKAAALALCALCVLGVRPWTPIAAFASLLVLLLDAMAKGLGSYTNHAQAVLVLVTLVLVAFPAADALSVRRGGVPAGDRLLYVTPMVVSALALTTSYLFVGVRRVARGGVEIFTGDSLELWLVALSQFQGPVDFDVGLQVLEHRWLLGVLGVGFVVVTAAEIASPFVLRWTSLRRAWLAVMVTLHLASIVTMRIIFAEHLLLMAVLLTSWRTPAAALVSGRRRGGSRWASRHARRGVRRAPPPGPPSGASPQCNRAPR